MAKPEVKGKADVVAKWVEEAPRRATYYEKYTPPAADKWEAETTGAAETYKSAVQAPDIGKRFAGGVKGKSAKFKRKVTTVGVGRFGPGITAAKDDYDAGIDWVLAEIAATEIPDRKPRGDPANWERSKKIGVALNKKRLARLAASPS